jgi:hypothetical protein
MAAEAFVMSGLALSSRVVAVARHVQVAQQNVEALACDVLQRLHHTRRGRDFKLMRLEDGPQSGQDRFVVINEKQFNGCQGETPCAGCTQTVSPGKQAVE